MKTAFIFLAYVLGGLATGFFSVYGMVWMGPELFHEGTPYLLALVGGMAGLVFYLYRGIPLAFTLALSLVGGVFVPLLCFAVLKIDISHRGISLALTSLGVLMGFGAARFIRMRKT